MVDLASCDSEDMFLKVETAKHGSIKGESQDGKHMNEICVLEWSWGMDAKTDMSGVGASAKATINQLNIVKGVDSASTGLMSALRSNDLIKKAILTVRKAGKSQHEYFKITIENGRITSLDVRTAVSNGKPGLMESLSFAFQKVSIDYVPQSEDGQPRGSMTFQAETTAG